MATTLLNTEALLEQNGNGEYLRHPKEIAHIRNPIAIMRTSECGRRKNASNLTVSLADCGKTGPSLKHCLAYCTSYMSESVAGKEAVVVRIKSCVICLHPNHGWTSVSTRTTPRGCVGWTDVSVIIIHLFFGLRNHRWPTAAGRL